MEKREGGGGRYGVEESGMLMRHVHVLSLPQGVAESSQTVDHLRTRRCSNPPPAHTHTQTYTHTYTELWENQT